MASDIDKLRSLYIKYDTLAASGDDVVADLRKEINNLELSVLRDLVLPKIAKLLYRETSELRCHIDCSLQSIDGKIEYSFCTDNSPLVRASISAQDHIDYGCDTNVSINSGVIDKLSSSLDRISQLSKEIEALKGEASECIAQISTFASSSTGVSPNKEKPATSQNHDDDATADSKDNIILYCRSQNCDAKGRLLPNGDIVILKGSLLRTDVTLTYARKKFRAEMLSQYCTLTGNGYVVLRDFPPMSVSGASGLCLGRSSNGNVDWKDVHGTCLADLT